MKPMRLIYIYHSGFIIESKEFAILIDYYRDTPEFYVHRHFLNAPEGCIFCLPMPTRTISTRKYSPGNRKDRTSGISCPKISATAKKRVFTMPFS